MKPKRETIESRINRMKAIRAILQAEKAHKLALQRFSVEDFDRIIDGLDSRIAAIETVGDGVVVRLEGLR